MSARAARGAGRGRPPVVIGALIVAAAAGSSARADGDDPIRVTAGVGLVVPVVNHTLYDAGVRARGGAELPVGAAGRHRLRVGAGWIGLATAGARVDVGLIEAAWRVVPSWGRGVRFELGSGLVFEVERFRLELPGQAVAMSSARGGVPASASVGVGLGRWVELELGYQQLLYVNAPSRSAGLAHLTLGGRL